MTGARLTLVLACCGWLSCAGASIVKLNKLPFTGEWLYEEPMFKSTEDEESYIHLDATFMRKKPAQIGQAPANTKAYIEVLAFHREARNEIGQTKSGTRTDPNEQVVLCCSQMQFRQGKCGVSKADEVVRTAAYESDPNTFYGKAHFNGSYTARFNPKKWKISRTGLYTVLAAVCEYEVDGTSVDGTLYMKNEYGYIPGHMRGFVPFWGWMLAVYGVMCLVWSAMACCYWKDLMHLQICITGLLAMGIIETLSWNITYSEWNDTGIQSRGLVGFSVVLGSAKRAMARMLVIVVSMGYGVVKPTLNDRKNKVILYGVAYFVFAGLLEEMTVLGHNSEYSTTFRLMFVLPVAGLDSVGAIWIFMLLSDTVSQLATRRQTAKLTLYRRFTHAMGAMVVLSVLWSLREMWVTSGPRALDFEKRWKQYWALEAFWPGLYLSVLACIMWLWAPSKNARRYAYSEELAFDSDDEYEEDDYEEGVDGTTVPLATLGDTKRRGGDDASVVTSGRESKQQHVAEEQDEMFFAVADEEELANCEDKMN